MKQSPKILFFGSDEFCLPAFLSLVENGYELVAVSRPDQKRGRGRKTEPTPLKALALSQGVDVYAPAKLDEAAIKELLALGAESAVVASYGRLIPDALLDHFGQQALNLHPSLLPAYRGPSPIAAAILAGATKTGISLMQITSKLDAGGIYAQIELPLTGRETRPELEEQLAMMGAVLLLECLPQILNGELTPKSQNGADATYTQLLKKSDGVIDWHQPAAQIERMVRAYLGWPGSRTRLGNIDVTITKARVGSDSNKHAPGVPYPVADGTLAVACAQGALIIERLKPAGKREMSGADFARGYLKS